jgi:hypothetical protein
MRKTTSEKIAATRERILQLQNEEKQLIQKEKAEERKARTRRFCSRHGLLEKFMPDLADITDEQFESFIKIAIATSYGREKLAKIVAAPPTQAATQNGNPPAQHSSANNANPTNAGKSRPPIGTSIPKPKSGGLRGLILLTAT